MVARSDRLCPVGLGCIGRADRLTSTAVIDLQRGLRFRILDPPSSQRSRAMAVDALPPPKPLLDHRGEAFDTSNSNKRECRSHRPIRSRLKSPAGCSMLLRFIKEANL